MNKKIFEGKRMVRPTKTISAVLEGYRLCFSQSGLPFNEPGFASLELLDGPDGLDGEGCKNEELGAGMRRRKAVGKAEDGRDGGFFAGAHPQSNGVSESLDSAPVSPSRSFLSFTTFMASRSRDETQSQSDATLPRSTPPLPHGVHGVAFLITEQEWAYVCETEGVSKRGASAAGVGYRVADVSVHTYAGENLSCQTLVQSQSFLRGRHPRPSARYLGLLRSGAEDNNLHASWQAYLAALTPYAAARPGQKLGKWLFFFFSIALLYFPMFVLRAWAHTKIAPSLRSRAAQAFAGNMHRVLFFAWMAHDCLEPYLGSGIV
ncbi:hypothetical protein H632_c70p1 [Helicosporidium sp. ATCC 50920]|nr:hypothetical protein H632_c70p1 [Helicosporidium sp. ATCC 50920]|eukprot:KDD76908.1 hypothetical protein H632_c70p1 [Helicosporidium sp. ATCC 50920]